MINQTPHISSELEGAFKRVNQDLLTMASRSRAALADAAKGFLTRDNALCEATIEADDQIDRLENEINRALIELQLRFRPVAIDMRTTIASMHLCSAFERIGDQSVTIARRALVLNTTPKHRLADGMEHLYVSTRKHFEDCLISYTERNPELAVESIEASKPLREQINQTIDNLADELVEGSSAEDLQTVIDLIVVARCMRNVVKQSINVAREVLFLNEEAV
ncbi:phosphate signaling complex PhoU family protein [Sulfuriroseicoccus oceanibius]|uniref:Uncharacterized protein n=1 Tax=Sulfuriroseicoccus oceanibius TaxID=2707525 RepID=A0A6B3L9M8_9BACT|nr:PhoU domain-containing protein [Sulfuriroseicoccus oceanibius]QQL46259.1 hypothetical protein G3M56_006705 [Sulfuriroseicoccus oceanibius]